MEDKLRYNLFFEGQKTITNTIPFFSLLFSLLWIQPDCAQAQWTRKQDATYDRGEMKTILYKDKIYHFSGFGIWPNVEPTNEVYNPETDIWTLINPMPEGKSVTHEGRVLVDNNIWCIGGRLVDTQGPLTSEVWIYNIAEDEWSPGPELIDPATGLPILWGGGGAALLGRTLHVFGGFITNTCNNDQDKYHLTLDIDKWLANPEQISWVNERAPMPIKRNHISTTVFKGKIYVIGGQFGHDCGGGQDQRYSHMYDPITDTWTRLTDLPTVRSHCEASIFPLDGRIYIAGGDGATNKITILNPEANSGLGSWENATFELPTNPYTNTNGYIGISMKVVGQMLVASCGKIGNTDPRRETYTRPITRNIPFAFGFGASCFSRTLDPEQKTVLKNLLYTVEGEKTYILSSNAAWLKVTKNASGLAIQTAVEIEATIDATGLEPGTYTGTVTATGTGDGPGFAGTSFCVNLRVAGNGATENSVMINAAGPVYTDSGGRAWGADAYFSGGVTSTRSFSVAGTTDDPLYLSYRFAASSSSSVPGAPFSYNIPVSSSDSYTVKLYFMEPYFGAPGGKTTGLTGARVFNVNIEGQRVINNYDIYAQDGAARAVVKTFTVSVTDGILNIDFISVKNNAIVSAIEVASAVSVTAASSIKVKKAADEENSLVVYPNPNIGNKIYVEANNFGKQEVLLLSIYEMTGRLLFSKIIQSDKMGKSRVQVLMEKKLQQGVYLIQVHGISDRKQMKLVVQ